VKSDDDSVAYKLWNLGATIPVSAAGSVIAGVTRVTNDVVNTDRNSTQLALGYTHSLSKRTNIYTSFSRIANDSKVNAGGLADGLVVQSVWLTLVSVTHSNLQQA
jgi:predicted porin